MKKIATFACVVVAVFMAAADPLNPKTATEAEFRVVLNRLLAMTNTRDMVNFATQSRFWAIAERPDLGGLHLEADSALAAKGMHGNWYAVARWPKLAAAANEAHGADKCWNAVPQLMAIARRLGKDANPVSLQSVATVDDMVTVLNERVNVYTNGLVCNLNWVQLDKRAIQSVVTRTIKRRLRERGRSFVTKNGVNPVEQCLTGINAALNAPRFTGLNEWLADLGYTARVDLSGFPSEQEVAALKDAVMYGDKPLNEPRKVLLYICLGVDGYNAFVKEYNGD